MSDALVQSYGSSLDEAFENAAEALTSVMVDLRRVSARGVTRKVTVVGFDEESLLYNWLEAVLVKKDIDREIFRTFTVRITKAGRSLELEGELHGEKIDPARHIFKRDVKAVTYHEMSVRKLGGRYVLRFLLDL